ncbi:homeobox protein engrailed-1-like [Aplysia californica]|uniref:Homeobox protein engrailed-1-like n=1 Tax=Aplysia californica TaxID=6500 RepID=A0ABM1W310_APLCA|nr:homeobox protein engrailed-1-like [Aplysia californica]
MEGQFSALLTSDDIGFLDSPDATSGFYFPLCGTMEDTGLTRSRFDPPDSLCMAERSGNDGRVSYTISGLLGPNPNQPMPSPPPPPPPPHHLSSQPPVLTSQGPPPPPPPAPPSQQSVDSGFSFNPSHQHSLHGRDQSHDPHARNSDNGNHGYSVGGGVPGGPDPAGDGVRVQRSRDVRDTGDYVNQSFIGKYKSVLNEDIGILSILQTINRSLLST